MSVSLESLEYAYYYPMKWKWNYTVTLPALLLQNGKFPSPASNYIASDIQKTSWGTLTFTFSDCNTAVVSWNSTLPEYGSGSMPITRLTQIAGTICP